MQRLYTNKSIMRAFEIRFRQAVRDGWTANFSSVLIYNSDNLIARGFTLSAVGPGGFNLDVEILQET